MRAYVRQSRAEFWEPPLRLPPWASWCPQGSWFAGVSIQGVQRDIAAQLPPTCPLHFLYSLRAHGKHDIGRSVRNFNALNSIGEGATEAYSSSKSIQDSAKESGPIGSRSTCRACWTKKRHGNVNFWWMIFLLAEQPAMSVGKIW